ncbi:protein of unknown function [Maridesulfovibrio hydrothermalis AM13 = DSM 14728]|uniref:Uncharacterized protein n=1 Tax=Maridesulfovibrio hydrothermalis AM13 = DSM 14728 TaxID=1121451 RepID=L0RCF7_9BACT|nr:protein of unknown function [Maridesulfovibrio hydrothermalis AM13 = DSM 14728]
MLEIVIFYLFEKGKKHLVLAVYYSNAGVKRVMGIYFCHHTVSFQDFSKY